MMFIGIAGGFLAGYVLGLFVTREHAREADRTFRRNAAMNDRLTNLSAVLDDLTAGEREN